jgi:hypothetical protein
MLSPPKAFGGQMESHAFRERFLVFLGGKPHRKFLKDLSNALQQLFGIKKVPIAKEGIVVATDFIKTSLPAWERVFALQPSILLLTLSIIP